MSKSSVFLERIHGDICGPIHPPCGPFRYFMVLIDAPTRWSHVCLLSTRNIAFSRLLAQMTKLRAQFPDYPIKTIRLDNAGEFTSQTLNDYPLLMKTKLPASTWGHAVMHAISLIRIRPTSYLEYSPSQLVLGKQPNISHLRVFGCAVHVSIASPQRTKWVHNVDLGFM